MELKAKLFESFMSNKPQWFRIWNTLILISCKNNSGFTRLQWTCFFLITARMAHWIYNISRNLCSFNMSNMLHVFYSSSVQVLVILNELRLV